MSNGYQGNQVVKSTIPFHFVAGLTSGILSAVLLQPADLLKTRLQQSSSNSLSIIFNEISQAPSPVRLLWRGTVPSALRTGIGSAIYFTTLNNLRVNFARYRFKQTSVLNNQYGLPNHSSSLPKLSNLANLSTGAAARTIAGTILMPMTIIKVRFESNIYKYASIYGAGIDILRTEGIKGFMSGVGATTARDAPYAGLYVLFYEDFKKRLSSYSNQVSETKVEMNRTVSASINFSSGMLAAGLATAFTNPFDAIKTRIQLQPLVYQNTLFALTKMIREEGVRCLLDGLGLRIARKALSSALAWTLYEEIIRKVELRWDQKPHKS